MAGPHGRDDARPAERFSHGTRRIGLRCGWLVGVALLGTVGCGHLSQLRTLDRWEQGYTMILPGIEGRSWWNANIAKGLAEGGVPSAIEVYDWTVGAPFVAGLVNLRAEGWNRRQARIIAEKIVNYQNQHPGRPVHLIGHSGGGGVAIYAVEELPPGHELTAAILLAPALSPDYDLRLALRRTQQGVWNFYSPHDVGFLGVGTSIAGTIDGRMTKAAGAIGFSIPWGLDREGRRLYGMKLHQQAYSVRMAESGHTGSHFGWAERTFVAEWLAPLLNSQIHQQARYATQER